MLRRKHGEQQFALDLALTIRSSQPLDGGDAVIRVHDEASNVIQTHEHKGEFKEP
jgi:hypothetical protein